MIVVCGEALVDLVPGPDGVGQVTRPGGSPANVATALGRLEIEVALLARLSSDHFGQIIREHLLSSRVDLSLTITTTAPSTVATVRLGPGGDARYTFAIDGGADDEWRADNLPTLPPAATTLHVSGSLALARPAMGDAVEALLIRERDQRVISFDPNPRPALTADVPALTARLGSWIGYADIVKLSAEDLAWTFPDLTVAEAARRWRAAGATVVVVTRGADGVYADGPAGVIELATPSLPVVDTVGAGDTFMAGLLAELSHRGLLSRPRLSTLTSTDLTGALRFAQRVAAVTCQRVGADPPRLSELEREEHDSP